MPQWLSQNIRRQPGRLLGRVQRQVDDALLAQAPVVLAHQQPTGQHECEHCDRRRQHQRPRRWVQPHDDHRHDRDREHHVRRVTPALYEPAEPRRVCVVVHDPPSPTGDHRRDRSGPQAASLAELTALNMYRGPPPDRETGRDLRSGTDQPLWLPCGPRIRHATAPPPASMRPMISSTIGASGVPRGGQAGVDAGRLVRRRRSAGLDRRHAVRRWRRGRGRAAWWLGPTAALPSARVSRPLFPAAAEPFDR